MAYSNHHTLLLYAQQSKHAYTPFRKKKSPSFHHTFVKQAKTNYLARREITKTTTTTKKLFSVFQFLLFFKIFFKGTYLNRFNLYPTHKTKALGIHE